MPVLTIKKSLDRGSSGQAGGVYNWDGSGVVLGPSATEGYILSYSSGVVWAPPSAQSVGSATYATSSTYLGGHTSGFYATSASMLNYLNRVTGGTVLGQTIFSPMLDTSPWPSPIKITPIYAGAAGHSPEPAVDIQPSYIVGLPNDFPLIRARAFDGSIRFAVAEDGLTTMPNWAGGTAGSITMLGDILPQDDDSYALGTDGARFWEIWGITTYTDSLRMAMARGPAELVADGDRGGFRIYQSPAHAGNENPALTLTDLYIEGHFPGPGPFIAIKSITDYWTYIRPATGQSAMQVWYLPPESPDGSYYLKGVASGGAVETSWAMPDYSDVGAAPASAGVATPENPGDDGKLYRASGGTHGWWTPNYLTAESDPLALYKAGAIVWNEDGADVNARFEGNNDQSLWFLDGTNDRMGLGTATPGAKLEVDGNASEKGILVKMNATTPGNPLEVQNSAGVAQFTVGRYGNVTTLGNISPSMTGGVYSGSSRLAFSNGATYSAGFYMNSSWRNFLFTDYANNAKAHDHAAQTNPTVWFHSTTDPDSDNTQWLSITHDQTDGVINAGKGYVKIGGPSGVKVTDGSTGRGRIDAGGADFYGYIYSTGNNEWIGGQTIYGNAVFNENGTPGVTFRVEGDADANLIYADTTNDRVGIGTATPGAKLDVNGNSRSNYHVQTKRYNADDPRPDGWPRTAANAADNEFDGESLAAWAWHTAAPSTVDNTTYPGFLVLGNGTTAKEDFYTKASSISTADFEVAACVHAPAGITNGVAIGVAFLDSAGTGFVSSVGLDTASTPRWSVSPTTTVTTWGAIVHSARYYIQTTPGDTIYVRVKRVSSNVKTYWSSDGMTWKLNDDDNYTTDIASIGLWAKFTNTSAGVEDIITVDWFRVSVP